MERYAVHLWPKTGGHKEAMVLNAPDIATALIVTHINLPEGTAEIWRAHKRIARIRKRESRHFPFWEVS